MSDLAQLDATIEMLLDIRDVSAEFEQARDAYYGSGKASGLERWEAAKRAYADKRTYWKGIRAYCAAVNVTAEPETVVPLGAAVAVPSIKVGEG